MRKIALSTAIFEGSNLPHLNKANTPCVEVSSHKPGALNDILAKIESEGIETVGVHGPAPNITGNHPNTGCEEKQLDETYAIIKGSFETAAKCHAKLVTIHSFYDLKQDALLPKEDEEKFAFLRRLQSQFKTMEDYLRSDQYRRAKDNAVKNLREIIRRLDQEFPADMALCLENLNPRVTYGLQKPSEFIEMYAAVGSPRLKMDMDLPHAHLSSGVYGFDLLEEVRKVSQHIGVLSLSQNHGGKYCIDRRFGETAPRKGLQDVDPHFPMHGGVKIVREFERGELTGENLAFLDTLRAAVMFDEKGELPVGTVPAMEYIRLLPEEVPVVLEYDNRYAPIDFLLKSFKRFEGEANHLSPK